MYNWDYNIKKGWLPKTERQWIWYLERKINYDDWEGLKKEWVKKYFSLIHGRLDPGKREMLKVYLEEK